MLLLIIELSNLSFMLMIISILLLLIFLFLVLIGGRTLAMMLVIFLHLFLMMLKMFPLSGLGPGDVSDVVADAFPYGLGGEDVAAYSSWCARYRGDIFVASSWC